MVTRIPFTRAGDNARFLLLMPGIQNLVRHIVQTGAQALGFFHAHRAHQNGLAGCVHAMNLPDHRVFLFSLGSDNDVGMVNANHRAIGGDHLYIQFVDFAELLRLGCRRARHAADLGILGDQVLHRDRPQNPALRLGCESLFDFDGGVQSGGPAPFTHDPAFELVDRFHLAILDQIIDVAVKE